MIGSILHDYPDSLDETDFEKEFPFALKKYSVENHEARYKIVKICKNCFIIYSLA